MGNWKRSSLVQVIVFTIGENIGSSVFVNGNLVPNTDLGNIEIKGISVEERASNKVRKEEEFNEKRGLNDCNLYWNILKNYFIPNFL
jgi:polyphosphate glucokinase